MSGTGWSSHRQQYETAATSWDVSKATAPYAGIALEEDHMTRPGHVPASAGVASVVLLVLALAGCSAGAGATTAPTAAPTVVATTAPTPTDAPASEPVAGGPCMPTDEPGTVEVTMSGRAFSTGRVEASVGEVIAFTNEDAVPHTATLDDGSCTTENLGKGATGSLVFDAPGTYPFHCRIHPDMTGTFEIS